MLVRLLGLIDDLSLVDRLILRRIPLVLVLATAHRRLPNRLSRQVVAAPLPLRVQRLMPGLEPLQGEPLVVLAVEARAHTVVALVVVDFIDLLID